MKNKHAQALVNARWAKTTPEERSAFASKAGKESARKRKKYGWAYWKKKDEKKQRNKLLKCILLFMVLPVVVGFSLGFSTAIPDYTKEVSSGVVDKGNKGVAEYLPPTNFCDLNFIECE
jgi:hypothetical protein